MPASTVRNSTQTPPQRSFCALELAGCGGRSVTLTWSRHRTEWSPFCSTGAQCGASHAKTSHDRGPGELRVDCWRARRVKRKKSERAIAILLHAPASPVPALLLTDAEPNPRSAPLLACASRSFSLGTVHSRSSLSHEFLVGNPHRPLALDASRYAPKMDRKDSSSDLEKSSVSLQLGESFPPSPLPSRSVVAFLHGHSLSRLAGDGRAWQG